MADRTVVCRFITTSVRVSLKTLQRMQGLIRRLHGQACAPGDYDNDGFADLHNRREGRVLLFHNEKNGTFKDVTAQLESTATTAWSWG